MWNCEYCGKQESIGNEELVSSREVYSHQIGPGRPHYAGNSDNLYYQQYSLLSPWEVHYRALLALSSMVLTEVTFKICWCSHLPSCASVIVKRSCPLCSWYLSNLGQTVGPWMKHSLGKPFLPAYVDAGDTGCQ